MRRNLLVMRTTVATAHRDLAEMFANRHANNASVSLSTNAYVVVAAKLTPGVTLSRAGGRWNVTVTFHHARYNACLYVPAKGTNPTVTVTLGNC
jgi:hypothetical protein